MSEEKDFVEVTLKLPKSIADFFSDPGETLEERLIHEIVELAYAQIDGMSSWENMEKYGLKPVFKEYGFIKEDEAK